MTYDNIELKEFCKIFDLTPTLLSKLLQKDKSLIYRWTGGNNRFPPEFQLRLLGALGKYYTNQLKILEEIKTGL